MKIERPHSSPFPEYSTARQEIKISPEDKPYYIDALNYTAETLINNPFIRPNEFTTTYDIPVDRCFVLSLDSDPYEPLRRTIAIPKGVTTVEYKETESGNQFSLTVKPEVGPNINVTPFTTASGDYSWLMQNDQGKNLAIFGKTDFAILVYEITKRSQGGRGDRYVMCKDAVSPYDLNFQLLKEVQKVTAIKTSELTYNHESYSGIKNINVHTSFKVFDSPEKRCLVLAIAEPSLPVYDTDDYASAPPPKNFIGKTTVFSGTIRTLPVSSKHLSVSKHLRGSCNLNYQDLLSDDERNYYAILRDYTKVIMGRDS